MVNHDPNPTLQIFWTDYRKWIITLDYPKWLIKILSLESQFPGWDSDYPKWIITFDYPKWLITFDYPKWLIIIPALKVRLYI